MAVDFSAQMRGEPFAPRVPVLRFDRYLTVRAHAGAIDLATGNPVDLEERGDLHGVREQCRTLFTSHGGRSLIDLDTSGSARVEVWEQWLPRRRPPRLETDVTDFVEMLECARHGAPRAFDLSGERPRDHEFLQRALAREARVRAWIPITVELLGALFRRSPPKLPAWLVDRSLVVFAATPGLSPDAVLALLKLSRRDSRPHVLVRTLVRGRTAFPWLGPPPEVRPTRVHEEIPRLGEHSDESEDRDTASAEAAARWSWLLADPSDSYERSRRAIALASVLVAREQPYEARSVLATVTSGALELAGRQREIADDIRQRVRQRARDALTAADNAAHPAKGDEMVDDFVDVLRICQDIEDEQTALARVGALLRERLQAASVAFVAREGSAARVLARVGSENVSVGTAVRTMETGVPVSPGRREGPVESAWPVRHAAEIIGAVWCRWSAGMPVAAEHASTLLGIAAAATAPSVRQAIARTQPIADRANPVPELVGDSAAMVAVREAIMRAAASPFPVVIEGESGSGKELAARAIHARSSRRDRRFCAINCAALVEELVEAELFGHVRGAFTGAVTDRPGVFEDANGGTLFLDEVAELGGRVQAKLLRTLQEGEIRRLGESLVRRVDVRVVAATNRPLASEVSAGRFRADLWYRLDVIRVSLPALRERIEDLPLLVNHLWRALAARTGSRAVLSASTLGALAAHGWPGNIRELQNVLASMLVSAPRSGVIGPAALPVHIARAAALERAGTLAEARRQFEERYVRAALAKAGGRTAAAARELGLSRQGLTKLMGRLGIIDPRSQARDRANVQ